jgi:hypothetical protein
MPTGTPTSQDFDPVIDGLRLPWDEVQLGRVLVRTTQAEATARELAQVLLDVARTSGSRADQTAVFADSALPLSDAVRCVDEAELLSREGFLTRRRRLSRQRGRVDLRLTDDLSFDLWVELKQQAQLAPEQAQDYRRATHHRCQPLLRSARTP